MGFEPTFKGYIEDEKNMPLIIQATIDGIIKHIPRRPYEIEKLYFTGSRNILALLEEIYCINREIDGR